jgi:acetyltransferase
MDLAPILRPRSIAVVGASPRSFVGRVALENSRSLGFGGRLLPINPKYPEVAGLPAAPSLAALDEPPDVVLIQVGIDRVLEVAREAAAVGARAVIVPGAGFTDSGAAATELQAALRGLARERGIAVVGTNCMGFVDLVSGAAPYIGTVPPYVRRGRVGMVAQSGAVVEAFVNDGGRIPFSTIVSCGTEAGTGLAEYLEFFAADAETRAVLAFVEGFADPAAFLHAARRLAEADKPLAVCKVGRSAVAQAGVAAHSGRLAGSARVAEAALRAVGAIICHDLDELTAVGELFGAGRTRLGRRAHVVTNSGGEANMLADLAEDAGLELPPMSEAGRRRLRERWPNFHVANPLDPWGVDDPTIVYPEVLETAADEPGDVLVMSLDQQTTCGTFEQQLGRDLAGYLADAAARAGKVPVFLSPTSQDPPAELASFCHGEGIALLRGARPALRALAAVAARNEWRGDGTVRAVSRIPLPELEAVAAVAAGSLDEDASLSAVARYGVPVPRRIRASSVAEAAAAADQLGHPVVVKAVGRSITHKTEQGLVRTGLATGDQVREAADAILAGARSQDPASDLLVVEQVRGDLELIAGFRRDEQFGPTVLVGLGGVWAEHLDTVAIRVGRIGREEARRMLDETLAGPMLRTARGGALDEEGVIDIICGLAALGSDHPEVSEIDLNPVLVGRGRAVAVDALIILESRPIAGEPPLVATTKETR